MIMGSSSVNSFISFFLNLLLIIISSNSASGLNFSLSVISPSDINVTVRTTGDANISRQGIEITPDPNDPNNSELTFRAGRATYIEPLQLWDEGSGKMIDFTTHFSFLINGTSPYADGFAFFLAPVDSSVSSSDKSGSGLGLILRDTAAANPGDPFVAVEFDTTPNGWDPPYEHVGIDINSMQSVNTTPWFNNVTLGRENNATISYDATSMNLRVNFTGFTNINGTQNGRLNWTIDLRNYLPEWVTFGFSSATGVRYEKNTIKSWTFNSTSLQVTTSDIIPAPPPDGRKNRGLVIGLVVSSFVLVVGMAILGCLLWTKRKKQESYFLDDDQFDMDSEFEKGSGPKKFLYKELARATNNFAEGEKLGQGGFGGVYKGFLKNGNNSNSYHVAVKKVSRGSQQGLKEYASEVRIISQLRHRNLVQLIGWCHERKDLLLVYELMPNGSLDSHLFKQNCSLTWEVRYKIAQGLASALLYLHEEWRQCVLHRDIKSSNVMLDSDFNAKLGDFGLARLVDHAKGSQTTLIAGTMGYMAPECFITSKASKESDVYSFGIVALEIASGRRPVIKANPQSEDDNIRTVEWVWELYGKGRLLEATDPKLNSEFDEEEMERLMVVALWCAHPDSNSRPSIRQAIQVLNLDAELPILPSTMPHPTYLVTSLRSFPARSFDISNDQQMQSSSDISTSNPSVFTSSSVATSASVSLILNPQ